MPCCHVCGGELIRKKRSFFRRLFYRSVYRCADCNRSAGQPRSVLTLFHKYCECPRCGTHDLSRLAQRDRIDRTSPNPFRRILILAGCPLYHCTFCRMQFRDWRKIEPNARPVKHPGAQRAGHVFSD